MEEKTEEAKEWVWEQVQAGERVRAGEEGKPWARMSYRTSGCHTPPNLGGFFRVRHSLRYVYKMNVDLTEHIPDELYLLLGAYNFLNLGW